MKKSLVVTAALDSPEATIEIRHRESSEEQNIADGVSLGKFLNESLPATTLEALTDELEESRKRFHKRLRRVSDKK